MGVPTITERKHFRLVPGEPEEPTSTIVLTSKDSYFVDVRLLREKYEQEKGQGAYTDACIDWAFAGRSHTKPQGAHVDGMTKLSHTVWDHWIDSKSNDLGSDEGDMWVQENGDVLERGKQKHPQTGEETEYEELWHDLEVDAFGKKQNRSSLVLRAEDPEKKIRGMAVKVGGWCQAVLKVGDALTVERWEWQRADSTNNEGPAEEHKSEERTHNSWVRAFRVGKGTLPCEYVCSYTSGKIGLHTTLGPRTAFLSGKVVVTDDNSESDVDWKVVEEYYW